ncbi:ABC transporter permease [Streptomyces decoyicus]|uniref:ABC transporter permease n=1 Tax=Streptomyces decoyicus TaxID=249567 RepID=UPI00345DA530
MSTLTTALIDSKTMLRRDVKHMVRNPLMMIASLCVPIFILLLFIYVFGGTMGAGLSESLGSDARYIDFVAPAVILMTVGFGSATTAVAVCMDMTEGIIARFRTMAIARGSVLTGHVIGSLLRTALSTLVVIVAALLMGFRPTATPVEWLAAIGVIAMLTFALTWLVVAFGLLAKSPETANSSTLLLQFLPFISSAFVPTESMPSGLAWFAHNQPFTPIIDTLRGLLMGTPIGNSAYWAVGWCLLATAVGYLWARRIYDRGSSH